MNARADVIVVGAGAAGLATAIFLGRARPGTNTILLESSPRVGLKILISGGGRCNITNARVTPADFYGGNPNVLRRILAAFPETAARAFFEEIGVPLHEEDFGKLFPDSQSARAVVDALLAETVRVGARILAGQRVASVSPAQNGFSVASRADGVPYDWHARFVVLATGGLSLPKTGSDGSGFQLAQALGHGLTPTTPALAPLLLGGNFHARLSGVAQDVELTFHEEGEKPVRIAGPLLWTHVGASGPVALDISRFWNRARLGGREARITVNFLPGRDFPAVEQELLEAAAARPKARVNTALRRQLPLSVAELLCREVNVAPELELGRLSRDARRRLVHALVEWRLHVLGTRGYNTAEVTAGGIPLSEINPATLESRTCPGLFLVGEILDVDGRIGGFNFQWAWSGGYVAGSALARKLGEPDRG